MTDVCVRGNQRGSGQVVTYALNTITNAKIQLGRSIEAMGKLDEFLQDTTDFTVERWLDVNGVGLLENMLIAGDDCVVETNNAGMAKALNYLNANGKTQKDTGKWTPSTLHQDWERVEFCSHHFHELKMQNGNVLVVPCRDESEVVGRSRIQKGVPLSLRESAKMAKSYAQMWQLLLFHRRDLRLGAMAICSSVPSNWVPTGRTTWSLHASHDWVTTEDMLSVWNRVWIHDNPWSNKVPVTSWTQIPYLPKDIDKRCGSQIDGNDRASWAKNIKGAVSTMRGNFPGEKFAMYLSDMVRYRVNEPQGF